MAHIGKDYPVLTRRDISLNVFRSYQRIPREWFGRFDWTIQTVPQTVYHIAGTFLAPISDPFDNDPLWESPIIVQHGKSLQFQATCDVMDAQTGMNNWYISVLGDGALRYKGKAVQPAVGDYGLINWATGAGINLYYDAAYWGGILGDHNMRMSARKWNQF